MSSGGKVRALAAKAVAAVLGGTALETPLEKYKKNLNEKDQRFLSALVYGCIRRAPRHEVVVKHLLRNPKKPINPMMRALLMLGLEQIVATRVPPHAAVAATVAAARLVNQAKGTGFLNAILRRYLRERENIEEALQLCEPFRFEHPQWMIDKSRRDWPKQWEQILSSNNHAPPMWLRVNCNHIQATDYVEILKEQAIEATASQMNDSAILLEHAVSVEKLPKFDQGWVSVQDHSAQLAAKLIDPQRNSRVLDACAAPGGKATHLLELMPSLQLTALDISARRLDKVEQNAQRLGFNITTMVANAAELDDWWNGEQFDAILLDAPCSGSGVIRRHPDIKILRRPKDTSKFNRLQKHLMDSLWITLKPGGRMIYATCSIFPEENEQFVAAQLERMPGAQIRSLKTVQHWGKLLKYGLQILPKETGGDGFYYAALFKETGS